MNDECELLALKTVIRGVDQIYVTINKVIGTDYENIMKGHIDNVDNVRVSTILLVNRLFIERILLSHLSKWQRFKYYMKNELIYLLNEINGTTSSVILPEGPTVLRVVQLLHAPSTPYLQ